SQFPSSAAASTGAKWKSSPGLRSRVQSNTKTSKMGAGMSWLSGLLWTKKEIRILILGLVRWPPSMCCRQYTGCGPSLLTLHLRAALGQRRKDDAPVQAQGPLLPQGTPSPSRGTTDSAEQIGEVVTTIPTIGFNVESVTYKNLNFNVWDLGGQTSIRPYWRCYYANTAAVIFVVDSTDIERLQTAADELSAMLNEDELKDAALLVFANKQDQPGAKGAADISEALRLGELRDRNWSIMACSAVDGSGVNEGMDWLVVRYRHPCPSNCHNMPLTLMSRTANREPGVEAVSRPACSFFPSPA
ncbi:hypothetical protein S7711_05712, partial [Stachybotrys chartarum IBT 7711]